MKLVLVLVLLLLSGCLQPASRTQSQPPPRYVWGFYYPSPGGELPHQLPQRKTLQDVRAWQDHAGVKDHPSAGSLPQGGRKQFAYGRRPIPPTVRVTWTTESAGGAPGQTRTQVVEIRSKLDNPEHFDGTIWLVYFGEEYGWTAEPVPSSPLVLVGDQQREKPIEQRVAEGLVKRPPPLQSTTRPAEAEEGGQR